MAGTVPGVGRTIFKLVLLTLAAAAVGRGVPGTARAPGPPQHPIRAAHGGGAAGLGGEARFSVWIAERGLVHRLAVFVDIEAPHPRDVQASLISPAGSRIKLLHGARSAGSRRGGIRGWYGAGGVQPLESLAALLDEPARGRWTLQLSGLGVGQLKRWRLWGQASDESQAGTYATYGQYSSPDSWGCHCDPFRLERD